MKGRSNLSYSASEFTKRLNEKPSSQPAFTPGQIVEVKGIKGLWVVPDAAHWIEVKKNWDHHPCYKSMTPEEFSKTKLRDCGPRGCINCQVKNDEPCYEYYLAEIDRVGAATGEVITHICESTIKLSKRSPR